MLLTFTLTCLAWIPFRSVSIDDAWLIARRIATGEGSASIPGAFGAVKGLSIVLLIVLLEAVSFRVDFVALLRRHPVLNIAYAIGCLLLLAIAGTYAGHAFIHFQF